MTLLVIEVGGKDAAIDLSRSIIEKVPGGFGDISMNVHDTEMPGEIKLVQEWKCAVYDPDGNELLRDRNWYREEDIAKSLLNDEYPNKTATGYRYRLRTRWVTEERTVLPRKKVLDLEIGERFFWRHSEWRVHDRNQDRGWIAARGEQFSNIIEFHQPDDGPQSRPTWDEKVEVL